MKYTFVDGREVEVEDIIIPESMDEMFKVNLPDNEEDYKNGNGEGVWACGSEETLAKWQKDDATGIVFIKILNDSTYYPLLEYETIIPVELRGNKRPIAILAELKHHYGDSKKKDVMRDIMKRYK